MLEGATISDDYVSKFDPANAGKRKPKENGSGMYMIGAAVAAAVALGVYLSRKKK